MTPITIILRKHIYENVYPPLDSFIHSREELNIINSSRIRGELQWSDSELVKTVNQFINNGKLIPNEYLGPFVASFLNPNIHNVYTSMLGSVEHFTIFENYISDQKYAIKELIYLKINDVEKLVQLATEKYAK